MPHPTTLQQSTKTHLALALGLLAAAPACAQSSPMAPMPGMSMPPPAATRAAPGGAAARHAAPMPGMDMTGMGGMSSSIDLLDPMSQEASGTAWLPSSTPLYGRMFMPQGNMLMLHGAVMPRYTDIGSRRGDRRFDAPNWVMAMFSHPLTADSQIGLRGMFSLDPVTEGGNGYPLLFQTGESWHRQPLHDRQHPHDLVDELAASYSHRLGGGKSAFLYLGYPGEPALGPPTYMHRLLAYDLADAPIGHHWQDATHITFGVATAGINFGSRVKLESSVFTGREPDENRYSFDKPRFDSQSARLSFNPNPGNAYQVSYGFVRNAESDGIDQHRVTASWLYNKPLGDDSNFTTALVFGQNDLVTEGKTSSFLAEADFQRGRNTVFTRLENIQKSGRELVLPEESLLGRKFGLGAYTLGYVRDLTHGTGIDTGLGFAVTADTHPSALNADYGGGTPLSFQVYLRLRPSRLKSMGMPGMDTDSPATPGAAAGKSSASGPAPASAPPFLPGMPLPHTAPAPGPAVPPVPAAAPPAAPAPAAPARLHVTASLVPAAPQARRKALLTLTLTDAQGKPVSGARIQAAVAMTSMDVGTSHPKFRDIGQGRYQGSVVFAMAGPWRVTVTAAPPLPGLPVTKTLNYRVGR